jgi:1-acyl-sn-glycerol-3-phosphate acyltransferase
MPPSLLNRLWYQLCRRTLKLVAVLVYRVHFSGRENIPASGGVLVVSNHQSHFDPPLVGIGCRRQMNYVARETLFHSRVFGWLLRSVGSIPIDRDGLGLSGIKESLKRLKRGEMVLIFPEGTRTSDGEIAPFRPGFTALAARSNAAILPVAVEGAFQVWPRTKKFPGFGKIRVHYGQPIPHSEIAGRDEREVLAEVERRVRECQAVLRQPAKSPSPADKPTHHS